MVEPYVLDTSVLVHLVRNDEAGQRIGATYTPLMTDPRPYVCVVTEGELRSLAYQFGWGPDKVERMFFLLAHFQRVSIDTEEILHAYAVIDAYSQKVGNAMGENDVWIAAVAHVTRARLLTTDKDFDHLHQGVRIMTYHLCQSVLW
jgi:predicted nucleic acid-binding protein